MGWKNYFYFQQSDKKAILLLLILIVVSGGVFLLADIFIPPQKQTQENEKAFAEFNAYQHADNQHLAEVLPKEQDSTSLDVEDRGTQSKYPTKIKLKEGQTLDINAAGISGLKQISGVGDVFAQRILDYRNALGGFASLEQLKEIKGVGKKKYEKLVQFVVIRHKPKLLKINSESADQLCRHPYLSAVQAKNIVLYRQQHGEIKSVEDLSKVADLSPRDIQRLKDYLSF